MESKVNKYVVTLFFCLLSTIGYAQSYKFDFRTLDSGDVPINQCITNLNQNIMLDIMASTKYVTRIGFSIFSNPEKGGEKLEDYNENSTFKLYLSNGEILTYSEGFYNDFQVAMRSFKISCERFTSNKITLHGNDNGYYVLSQLRKYNITKISIDSWSKTLSNFRSAATIDAMCKKIMRETGLGEDHFGASPNGNSGQSSSSGSTGSGSSRSISEIELPLKLEAGPGLKMKLISASEGFYSAIVPHEDWKGKATDYVVTVSTQTGKYLDDTSLEEFTLEKEGVFDVDPNWVSVRHNSTRALLLRVSPFYSSSSRYARIHIKVNGKEAGQIFLIQKAEGAEVE